MDDANMMEVFKRLGERAKPLLDERELPLPIPDERKVAEPLFITRRREMMV